HHPPRGVVLVRCRTRPQCRRSRGRPLRPGRPRVPLWFGAASVYRTDGRRPGAAGNIDVGIRKGVAMQRVTEVPKPESLNVIALVRGPETYIITWTDGQYGAALRTIGKWAA